MKLFANIFGFIGEFIAKSTSTACWWTLLDEEETPDGLL